MKFLPVIIVLELIISAVFLAIPPLRTNYLTNHQAVLGAKEIAQADIPTDSPTDTPTDTPIDESTPLDTSSPLDTSTPIDTSTPADTSTPLDTSSPVDTSTPLDTTPAPTDIAASAAETPVATSSGESNALSIETLAVLDSVSTTDLANVDQSVVQQVQEQNKQSDQATTPEIQVQTGVDAGKVDIQTISSSLNTSSFANVNLITQVLSQHIDKSSSTLNQISSDQKPILKQNLANFCTNADISLRSSEEMVLEESEQDMELIRAKCFNIINN